MTSDRVAAWMDEEFAGRWRRLADAAADNGDERSSPAPSPDRDRADKGREPVPIAVVERDLPDGLFGFTSRDSDHVTVNRALYKVDRERTIRHEKTHHRHPKDELTIRYINGDIDVENTLSFQASNRTGRRRRRPHGTAAYGDAAVYSATEELYDAGDPATL